MSTTVTYKGSTLTTAENQTRTLKTSGKYLEDDITIVDVTSGGSVTQDANGYIVLPSTGGGGSSNFVTNTFTTSSEGGSIQTITIPYNGSGYPVMVCIYVEGGMYNSSLPWYNTEHQNAIGQWLMVKSNTTTTPSYNSTSADNGVTNVVYKGSSATSYNRTGMQTAVSYSQINPQANTSYAVTIKDATTILIFVASTGTGFLAETEYRYCIMYSS